MNTEILELDTEIIDTPAPPVEALTIYKDKSPEINITDVEIQKFKDDYLGLTIANVKDSKGYNAVDNARKTVRQKRLAIHAYTEDVKSMLNNFKSKLIADDERVCGELLAIEIDMKGKLGVIDDEKERLKEEEKKKQLELLNTRKEQLSQYEYPINEELLKKLTLPEFESLLASAKMLFDAAQIYQQQLAKMKKDAEDKLQQDIAELNQQKLDLEKQTAELKASVIPAPAIVENNIEETTLETITQLPGEVISLFAENNSDEQLITDEIKPANEAVQKLVVTVSIKKDSEKILELLTILSAIEIPKMSKRECALAMSRVAIKLDEAKEILKAL